MAVLSVILDLLILPFLFAYYILLWVKSGGRWHRLPVPLQKALQPYFSFDLGKVRYSAVKKTGKRLAITFGRQVFFPKPVDLGREVDIKWLIHELTHSQQYHQAGGILPFLHKYVLDITRNIMKLKSFRVYQLLHFEKDSDRHVAEIIHAVMDSLRNEKPDS